MAKVIKSPLPCSGRLPPKKREPPGTGFCPGCGGLLGKTDVGGLTAGSPPQ